MVGGGSTSDSNIEAAAALVRRYQSHLDFQTCRGTLMTLQANQGIRTGVRKGIITTFPSISPNDNSKY